MARRPKEPAAQAIDAKNQLNLRESDFLGKTLEQVEAASAQSPIHGNASTSRIFSQGTYGVSGITESVEVLTEKIAKVKAGDMSDMEAMLVAQATALDSIFTELARRAALNMGQYVAAADTYLRLALKAQSQARNTVEVLAEIKHPRPVAFVRQANIAHGPQQINNGTAAPSQAGENEIEQNKLLEERHGQRLDTLRAGQAIEAHSRLAPVGAIDRTED